jgi:hypothetical protein
VSHTAHINLSFFNGVLDNGLKIMINMVLNVPRSMTVGNFSRFCSTYLYRSDRIVLNLTGSLMPNGCFGLHLSYALIIFYVIFDIKYAVF